MHTVPVHVCPHTLSQTQSSWCKLSVFVLTKCWCGSFDSFKLWSHTDLAVIFTPRQTEPAIEDKQLACHALLIMLVRLNSTISSSSLFCLSFLSVLTHLSAYFQLFRSTSLSLPSAFCFLSFIRAALHSPDNDTKFNFSLSYLPNG